MKGHRRLISISHLNCARMEDGKKHCPVALPLYNPVRDVVWLDAMFRGSSVVLLLSVVVAVRCVVDNEPSWWKVYWLNSPVFDTKALLGPKLHHISKKDPEVLKVFREAFVDSLVECKRHAKSHRWNCEIEGTHPFQALFPSTSGYASREYAFFLALSTASAVRSVARACAQGRLRGCSCDPSKRGPVHSSPNKLWSPCGVNHGSDNIRYANRLTKRLIDRPFMCHFGDNDRQIHLHNIAVGRTGFPLKTKIAPMGSLISSAIRIIELFILQLI
uniref:Protein Wnt n=1 Tax=Steinernema glaseri TaxID=37863 RepID=A0A1I7Y016_9BILA